MLSCYYYNFITLCCHLTDVACFHCSWFCSSIKLRSSHPEFVQ